MTRVVGGEEEGGTKVSGREFRCGFSGCATGEGDEVRVDVYTTSSHPPLIPGLGRSSRPDQGSWVQSLGDRGVRDSRYSGIPGGTRSGFGERPESKKKIFTSSTESTRGSNLKNHTPSILKNS